MSASLPDATAPVALSAKGEDGPGGIKIVVSFSEGVQRGDGAIVLRDARGRVLERFDAALSGRLSFNANTLTIDPARQLLGNTRYSVSFEPGSVNDLNNNPMASSVSMALRTPADRTAPTVTIFSPDEAVGGVAPSANIRLTFSEDIKRGTGNIVIRDENGRTIETFNMASSKRIVINKNALTINPTKDLAYDKSYTVSVAPGAIRDLAGNRFGGEGPYNFRTEPDTYAPSITRYSPLRGALNVAPQANLSLSFNEGVQRGNGNIVLRNAAGDLIETFDAATSSAISISRNVLTVNPTANLSYNTQYVLSLEAGSLRDLAGNDFGGTSSYSFKTRRDTFGPIATEVVPVNGVLAAAPEGNITLVFDENIRRGRGNIVIRNEAGQLVESFSAATSNRISINGRNLTINPTRDLSPNSKYSVSFAGGALTDEVGNQAKASPVFRFRTGAAGDGTPPTVTTFNPSGGPNNATIAGNISVTFSEAVQRGSGTIQILNANDQVVESFDAATSDRISLSNNTMTIDPTNSLLNGRDYRVVLSAEAVKDLAGNSLAGQREFDFRTAASAFNIDLVYNGDETYRNYFTQAKAVWESVIVGDLPDIGGIDDIRISASVGFIDGNGGTLGTAGPTQLRIGIKLPTVASMNFDSADMSTMANNGTLLRVILHEMGHALGLGTLWGTFGLNTVNNTPNGTPSYQYTGAQALNEYRQFAGQNSATYVPLETGGGAGTANAHWSESLFQGELMTGYATGSMPLSRMTIGALADLGYQVNYAAADPYVLGASLYSGSFLSVRV